MASNSIPLSENPMRMHQYKSVDGFVAPQTPRFSYKTPSRLSAIQYGSNAKTTAASGSSARRALGDVSNTAKKSQQQPLKVEGDCDSVALDLKTPLRERRQTVTTPTFRFEVKNSVEDSKNDKELATTKDQTCEEFENDYDDIEYIPPSCSLPDDYSDVWLIEDRRTFADIFKKFVMLCPDPFTRKDSHVKELDPKPPKMALTTLPDVDFYLEDFDQTPAANTMKYELIDIPMDDL